MEEVQGRLGGGGEVAAPNRGGLAATTADDIGDAVDRVGALVVVIVTGENQIDAVAVKDGREHGAGPGVGPVPARRVRRMVKHDDLPLIRRDGERVVEPLRLLGCARTEEPWDAGVEVEEVGRPMRRRVVGGGGAEQS